MSETPHPFQCTVSPDIPELLASLGCSLVISTYQAGKVILVSSNGNDLIQLPRNYDQPMGLAVEGDKLAVATKETVVVLANSRGLAGSYPGKPGVYDGMFVPHSIYFTGRIAAHDLAWAEDGLLGINTSFSCLCKIDHNYSFTPIWKPSFITELASEDRCHLNGLALVNKKPAYATSLGTTNTPQGWREDKLKGGALYNLPDGEIILNNLPMPHSPRIFHGKLYLLLSATGELVCVDPKKGSYDVINRVDGFVRGLAYYKDHLFIGVSKLRNTHTFGDLPLTKKKLFCGVMVVHLPTGALVGKMEYQRTCEEIYDVQVLPNLIRPNILAPGSPEHRRALSIPETSYWGEVPNT